MPAVSTIWRILSRRGFVTPQPQKRHRSSWKRFCAEQPNQRWQADITHWGLADGTVAVILNILLGVRLAGTPVSLLIDDRHIRVIHRHSGQLIRELILNPLHDYHPRATTRATQRHTAPPTGRCPRSPPTRSARSQGQGWPQATRKGIGLDRGEDDATITNRGAPTPETIFNKQPEMQRCPKTPANGVPRHHRVEPRGLEPLTPCLQSDGLRLSERR